MSDSPSVKNAVAELAAIYDKSVSNLRGALDAYISKGVRPSAESRRKGAFAYPELRVHYDKPRTKPAPSRAFARLNQPGTYASTFAQP